MPDSKNIFQLFFRSRMEGKKADIACKQQNNLLYKGACYHSTGELAMAPYQPGKGRLCSFPDTTAETNGSLEPSKLCFYVEGLVTTGSRKCKAFY